MDIWVYLLIGATLIVSLGAFAASMSARSKDRNIARQLDAIVRQSTQGARDLRSEVRAIEAMGRIGGEEAEAYLEMTAVGHEVPEVQALSKDLLKKMKRGRSRASQSR